MQLPNCDNAYIPREKLTTYLLSETHPVGKSKAQFFRLLGFNESNVDGLTQELLSIAQAEVVTEIESTVHGMKYVVEGELRTPIGSPTNVRTVWIIEKGENRPRFVTAYPA